MPGYRYRLFDCKVRLRGADNMMIVPKEGVTIPEIRVLQEIHGTGNVIEVMQSVEVISEKPRVTRPRVRNNVPAGGEVDRLRHIYNLENRPIVDKLFPGAYPQLPTSLAQLGVTLWAPPVALAPELGEDDAPAEGGEPDDMSEEELEAATAPNAEEIAKEAEIRRRFTEGQEKLRRNQRGQNEAASP